MRRRGQQMCQADAANQPDPGLTRVHTTVNGNS
jgi:hypothetical protein